MTRLIGHAGDVKRLNLRQGHHLIVEAELIWPTHTLALVCRPGGNDHDHSVTPLCRWLERFARPLGSMGRINLAHYAQEIGSDPHVFAGSVVAPRHERPFKRLRRYLCEPLRTS